MPRSPQEVASVLKAVVAARQKFAVRSGGHTSWPGANNIKDGVTIDLSLLNTVTYDAASGLAKLGPGATWGKAYKCLSEYGLTLAGGRAADVGVGGLLLGGGKSFLAGRHGFACDSVVSYEVVLASGDIILVNKDEHAELFRALKGGGNNFGIVTSFEMTTIKCDKVWAGMMFMAEESRAPAIAAMSSFTDNMSNDPDSNALCLISHSPQTRGTGVVVYCAQMAGVESPPAYKEFQAIPRIASTLKTTTNHQLASDCAIPTGYYNVWYTLTLKNDVGIMTEAARLHDETIAKIKAVITDGDFTTQCLFQPVPTIFAAHAHATGGNSMGVERHKHNGILFLAAAMLKTGDQAVSIGPMIEAWGAAVKTFAEAHDMLLPWLDLNYASPRQDPLASYGRENVERMRRVAARYDPHGVFQTLCPGGFKITRVKDADISS
ncbi:hypothetical protein GGS21DRAFT_531612 [Xylaria nigripes]|nr:hypothetical protein GGS21DRAFT_531612 [Xylaria nigripes]